MRRAMIAGLALLALAGGAQAEEDAQQALEAYAKAVGIDAITGVFAPTNFTGRISRKFDVNANALLPQLGFSSKTIDPGILGIEFSGDRKTGFRIEGEAVDGLTIGNLSQSDGGLRIGTIGFRTLIQEQPGYTLRSHFTATGIRRPNPSAFGPDRFSIGAWQVSIDADAVGKDTDRVHIETEILDLLQSWIHGGTRARKVNLDITLGTVPHGDMLRYMILLDPITRFVDTGSLNPMSPRLARARDIEARLTIEDGTIGMACPSADRLEIGMKADRLGRSSQLALDVSVDGFACPIDPFILSVASLYGDEMKLSARVSGADIASVLLADRSTDAADGTLIAMDDIVLRGKNRYGTMELGGMIRFQRDQSTPRALDLVLTATGTAETLAAFEREKAAELAMLYKAQHDLARAFVKLGEPVGDGKLRWKIAYSSGGTVVVNNHVLTDTAAIGSLMAVAVGLDAEARRQAEQERKSALPKIE